MKRFDLVFCFVLSTVLLTSCQSNELEDGEILKKKLPESLIHYQIMFSELDREISFPLWFNDSVAKANKIKTITRSIYPKQEVDMIRNEKDEIELDTSSVAPREQWIYWFRKDGSIEKVIHRNFYDQRQISQFVFNYAPKKRKEIFSAIKMDSVVRYQMDENQVAGIDRSEDMYRNYNQIKFNKLFTAYQNKESNEVLFLLRGKKVPNPLDLGKLLNPKPIDRIIAGYLPFPSKIFSVQNRVEENRVSNFKYKNKNIVSIEFIDFPFKTIRSFDYDVSGYCIGYIDSLFANEEYLTKSRTQFVLNQFHAPNSVVHFKKNKESKMGLDYVVNFQYVLYP